MKTIALFVLIIAIALPLQAEEGYVLVVDQFFAQDSENIQMLPEGIFLVPGSLSGYILSEPLTAEIPFNVCSIAWEGDERIELRFRVSANGREWTDWAILKENESDFSWETGPYRLFQYQADFREAAGDGPLLRRIAITYDRLPERLPVRMRDSFISSFNCPPANYRFMRQNGKCSAAFGEAS